MTKGAPTWPVARLRVPQNSTGTTATERRVTQMVALLGAFEGVTAITTHNERADPLKQGRLNQALGENFG